MKKSAKIITAAFAVVLVAIMGVSLGLNVLTLSKISTLESAAEKNDPSRENGVMIVNRYEVKSTEQISDAYISGDSSGLDERDKATLDTAKKILKDIIKKGMTDYEKEVAVYEWIQKNIKHDNDILLVVQDPNADTYTPQGVLAGKTAVCVGYATTFRMFMQMLGIDCKVVHDNDLSHTWDLVKIGSGWYHTDLYFDTPKSKFAHFNLTDSMRANDYSWDESIYPRGNSFEYCYAVMNADNIKNAYQIPKKLKSMLDKKDPFFSYKMTDPTDIQKSEIRVMLDKISESVFGAQNYENYYFSYNTIQNGKDFIAYASIVYPDPEDDNSIIDEKTEEKIRKAIDKVFSNLVENNDIIFDEGEIGEAATSKAVK